MNDKEEIISKIEKFYKIISGDTGEERKWADLEDLFSDDARIKPVRMNPDFCEYMSLSQYRDQLSELFENGSFYETGYNYKVNVFNQIASVHSEYKAVVKEAFLNKHKQGVCFIHLVKHRGGWKISSMLWQDV